MTNTNEKIDTKKNPPVRKLRVDNINVSIWKNVTDKGTFYHATFDNRYRDARGNWKSGHSYGVSDLLSLAKAADQAHTHISGLRAGEEE